MADPVLVTRTERPNARAILTVTLNRPEARNALTRRTLAMATAAIVAAGEDTSVGAIVLTGAGEGDRAAFCAGADLRATFAEDPTILDNLEGYLDDFHSIIRAIWHAPKLVLARVDGGAVGFGCDLALVCDLRVVSSRGYFQESFTKIGLMPDGGGTGILASLVGIGVAKEMVFLASKVDAQRAQTLGLATRVVDPHELDAATLAMASQLADAPPIAFAESKRAMQACLPFTLDALLTRERTGQLRCLRSSDAMEGIAAWTQKRAPQFTGK